MERQFDIQLEKLKTKIIKMSSLVDEQVEFAVRALMEENEELAKVVIERDNKVDKYDLKIDKQCQKIIALNQPVAMDLRLIMSALTINNDLERIGDIAASIAKHFLLIKHKPVFFGETKFEEMFLIVKEMIKNAIDSFIDGDAKLSQKVIQTDKLLDKLNAENIQILISKMKEDVNNIDSSVSLLIISRNIERMGDHATNLAEDIYFIYEAQLIKHKYEKYFMDETDNDDED